MHIFVDWDDTLLPAEIDEGADLAVQDGAALHLLTQASRLSVSLSIVTLSTRPWVATSARRWLPRTADFLERESVPVYYAREHVTARDWRRAATDDCQSLGTLAKRRGMEQSLDDQAAEGRIVVVSIGDSDWEKHAAQELAWWREGATSRVIRVRPPPGAAASLSSQLRSVVLCLERIRSAEGDVDFDAASTDDLLRWWQPGSPEDPGLRRVTWGGEKAPSAHEGGGLEDECRGSWS